MQSNYVLREAALAAQISDITTREESKLSALIDARIAAQAAFELERSKARERAEATRLKLAGELLKSLNEQLGPLVQAFVHEPTRAIVRDFAAALVKLDARSTEELGCPLWTHAIGCVLAIDVLRRHPDAVSKFSENNWGSQDALPSFAAVATACIRGSATEVHDALVKVEGVLDRIALTAGPANDDLRARFAIKQTSATHRDFVRAIELHDAAVGSRQLRASVASFVAPPSLIERSLAYFSRLSTE